jgi:hypothetical protein
MSFLFWRSLEFQMQKKTRSGFHWGFVDEKKTVVFLRE